MRVWLSNSHKQFLFYVRFNLLLLTLFMWKNLMGMIYIWELGNIFMHILDWTYKPLCIHVQLQYWFTWVYIVPANLHSTAFSFCWKCLFLLPGLLLYDWCICFKQFALHCALERTWYAEFSFTWKVIAPPPFLFSCRLIILVGFVDSIVILEDFFIWKPNEMAHAKA